MIKHAGHSIWIVVLLVLLSAPRIAAAEGRSYLDLTGGYKTGDFGTPVTTNLDYISIALGYVSPKTDINITIPYLFQSSNGAGVSRSESGIGDIILRGDRMLAGNAASGFSLDGAVALKLPTADETKGLGTGETDFGAFLNAHQWISDFKLSVFGGYIIVGEPSNVTLNDVYVYGAGVSRIFGLTQVYASFEGRRNTVPGFQNPQEIHFGIFHALNKDYAIKGHLFTGLNNGGPDFGLDAGIVRFF